MYTFYKKNVHPWILKETELLPPHFFMTFGYWQVIC